MSAVEKIKRLQIKKKKKERTMEGKMRREQVELFQRERQELELRKTEIKRRKSFRTKIGQEVLKASGVLDEINSVNSELLGGLQSDEARLFIDDDHTRIILAWGRASLSKFEGVWSFNANADCRYIIVQINPDEQSIMINNVLIPQSEWQNNPDLVSDAIAHAYVEPNRRYPYLGIDPNTESPHRYCCN